MTGYISVSSSRHHLAWHRQWVMSSAAALLPCCTCANSCASRCTAGVPNGQPKLLLNLFLPGYPLVNFAVCTAVYVFVSYRLFFLTNALKNVAIPGKEMGLLWRNGAIMAVSAAVRM